MIEYATEEADSHNLKIVEIVWVPGSMEVPLAAARLLEDEEISGVACLGIIEKGETQHGLAMGQAVIIGAIGGIICMYGMKLLDMLKIDDVVGAIPAHLFAGIWGTLVVAWTNPDASLGVQAIGVVSYGLFTVIMSFIVWYVIKVVIGIRASKEDEEYGLDMSELGTVSYPDFNKSK